VQRVHVTAMDSEIDDLILAVYDASADPGLWPAVLDRCAAVSGALSCAIFDEIAAGPGARFAITHMCAAYSEDMLHGYSLDNLEQEIADRSLAKKVLSSSDRIEALNDEAVYEDYDEFLSRPNVRSLREIGLRHRVIAFLNKDNLGTGQFTLQYPDGRGPATQAELSRLNMVLPHLAKAIDLGRSASQLAAKNLQLMAAMNHLAIGICVLDRRGRLMQENTEFRRQRETAGVFKQTADGQLRLKNGTDQKRFHDLMRSVGNHGKFGARPRKEAIAKQGSGYLCVEMVNLNRVEEFGSGTFKGYVLYSTDTSRPMDLNTGPIRQAFGLTEAEAALVDMIARGLTNKQIAELKGKAVPTINGQVKAILAKTDCTTRTQFVRLLMGFGGNLVAG